LGARFDIVNGVVKRISYPFFKHQDIRPGHLAVNIAPGQICAIVEFKILVWSRQVPSKLQSRAVRNCREAGRDHLYVPVHRYRFFARKLNGFTFQFQSDDAIMKLRLIIHHTRHHDAVTPVVMGDVISINYGDGRLASPCPQAKETDHAQDKPKRLSFTERDGQESADYAGSYPNPWLNIGMGSDPHPQQPGDTQKYDCHIETVLSGNAVTLLVIVPY
jgi:hypothetical protein